MREVNRTPRFEVRAQIVCPRIWSMRIPRELENELKKRKYAKLGISLEQIMITELRE